MSNDRPSGPSGPKSHNPRRPGSRPGGDRPRRGDGPPQGKAGGRAGGPGKPKDAGGGSGRGGGKPFGDGPKRGGGKPYGDTPKRGGAPFGKEGGPRRGAGKPYGKGAGPTQGGMSGGARSGDRPARPAASHRGDGAERIAKVIARAGLASRREAEAMIAEGRVTLNGKPLKDVSVNVRPSDTVAVDGAPLPERDAARVWLYHKPAGLVTTERDEKGRETVFDALPDALGRVLSVGRLDLTSEGLLLLTNDGELKRRLELPATGWLRRYRVRVNGTPDEASLQRLRDGVTVDGEDGPETFQGMDVTLDRQKGANAWLTVGLREGRNREIRRAAEAVGLVVNRLIRVSYGPFQLGELAAGAVEEVKPKVLRDQLGGLFDGELAETRREGGERKGGPRGREADAGRDGRGPARGRNPRSSGDRLMDHGRGDAPERGPRSERGDRPDRGQRPERGPRREREDGPAGRTRSDRGDRPDRGPRERDERPSFSRDRSDRGPRPDRPERGDRPVRGERPGKTGGPRFAKPGVTRNDGADVGHGAKKPSPAERKAAMRADTSISLRKGGQKGWAAKKKTPAKPAGKPYVKPPRKPR